MRVYLLGVPVSLAWPVSAVVVAVIGAVTYLGSVHVLAASDITTIIVLILGAVGITTTAHVTANAVAQASQPAGTATVTEKLV